MPQGEKLNFKPTHRHYALVTLKNGTVFPIDLLRYDKAMPWKEYDARQIQDSCWQIVIGKDDKPIQADPPKEPRHIIVCRETGAQPGWMIEAWTSHGGLSFNPITPEEAHRINNDRENIPERLQYPELAKY